jgi:TetR/AcrR family transcriptional repressor of mexJK operon
MGRKKQNPEESAKRRLILKTAEKMFMTCDYNAVSMDGLADAVPVSKRTLYNHFKDKKALFTAVMQNRCQLLFNNMERTIQENQSVEQTLTTIGKHFLALVFEPDTVNIHRTAITQSAKFPELGQLFYESGPKRSTGALAAYFKKLHTNKILWIPKPELAASAFIGMLKNNMQMKCILGLKKHVSAKEKNDMIKYAVRVFLHGQQPR